MGHGYAGKRGSSVGSEDVGRAGEGLAPGKRTLTEGLAPVQRTPAAGAEAMPVQRTPAAGAEGAPGEAAVRRGRNVMELFGGGGSALPHLGQIQRSFGRHDVSNTAAHIGGEATEAAHAMGAAAYATGQHIAFAATPDLHTAAHEAAHVVQQRGGVTVPGGVGRAGDRYEQHADAVADRVVRGESSEALLDQVAGAGGASPEAGHVVQRLELNQTQINALPLLDPRQLRALLTQAEQDHESLSSELGKAEQLLALQEIQAEVIRMLDGSPAQVEAMSQHAARLRGEIESLRQIGAQLLAGVVDPMLEREVQQWPPAQSEQDHQQRQQAIANRRQQLTAQAVQAPELQPQLQELQRRTQPLQQHLGELERGISELLLRMQQAMQERLGQIRQQHALPDDIPTGVLDLIRSFRSNPDVGTLRQNVQQLRQRVQNNQSAGQAVQQVYRNLGMIATSQDVIAETQTRLSVGAGNQIQDLARTNGLSRELTNLVRSIQRMPSHDRLVQIAQEGAIASMLHAGNCGEHGSVAYCLLWQRLPGQRLTYYAHSMDHAFVVIGDPGDLDSVVCDAWPRSATAVRLRDFFVRTGITNLNNVRYTAISNGGDLMAQARHTVDIDTIESRMEEERAPISQHQAQQQFGGRGVYDHQHTHG